MTISRRLATLLVFATLAACGNPQQATTVPADPTQKDVEAIQVFLTEIEQSFNSGQIETFLPVFAEDAVISSQGAPDIVGAAAIRGVYEGAMSQANMQVKFDTKEILAFGDLAYESGTFTVKSSDRNTGRKSRRGDEPAHPHLQAPAGRPLENLAHDDQQPGSAAARGWLEARPPRPSTGSACRGVRPATSSRALRRAPHA